MKKFVVEDLVNNETSRSIDLTFLKILCENTGIYPKKTIIKYHTDEDKGNGKTRAYCDTDENIVFLISKKQKRKFSTHYINWLSAHEHRHLQQMKDHVLHNEIISFVKVRKKRTPKLGGGWYEKEDVEDGICWKLVRKLVDWQTMVEEMDAYIYASTTCGYMEPRRVYEKETLE